MQVEIRIPILEDPTGVRAVGSGRCPCVGDGHPLVMFWFKKVGDTVTRGEPLLEIAAGWTIVDVPAPVGGVLASVLVPGSQTAAEGGVVGMIETPERSTPA